MSLEDAVRTRRETELDRLGSQKALLAVTDATLERATVLEAAGGAVATARATLADWAADAGDEAVAAALSAAADALREAAARIADSLEADLPGGSEFVTLEAGSDAERVGAGLVGLPLVLDRLFLQCVSFFVNEADGTRADLFRDLRATTGEMLAAAADLDLDGDAERAAVAVVTAAYEAYVDRLEAMGFDPKPIC
ncbi:MAG: transcription antitermination protein [Salinirussus sp.]